MSRKRSKKKWIPKQKLKKTYPKLPPLLRKKNDNDRDPRKQTKKSREYTDARKLYLQKHYQENKAAKQAYTRGRKREMYYKIFCHRYQLRCVRCGESDYRVLDYDHIDPSTKVDSISGLISRGSAWWRVEEELEKCQVLCSNCHRIKTFEDTSRYDFELQYLIENGLIEDPHKELL